MNPLAIIREAQDDGVELSLSPAGIIKASGNSDAVGRWLPVVRERRAEIARLLRLEPGHDLPPASNDPGGRRQYWLIHFPDREPLECSFTPEQPHAEALAWYPEAIAAEPFTPTITQPDKPLSASEVTLIRAWLEHIGETDPATIAEVMSQCQQDEAARRGFIRQAITEVAL